MGKEQGYSSSDSSKPLVDDVNLQLLQIRVLAICEEANILRNYLKTHYTQFMAATNDKNQIAFLESAYCAAIDEIAKKVESEVTALNSLYESNSLLSDAFEYYFSMLD